MSESDELQPLYGPSATPDPKAPERRAVGRYQLQEAAEALAAGAGGAAERWLGKLIRAAGAGALPVYLPGSHDRYRPETVRQFWEEAYGSDLNLWLDTNEERIEWRFPPDYSPEFIRLRHEQADAAMLRWKLEHAAQSFSAAVNFHHAAEDMTCTTYETRADFLAAHGPDWDQPATPGWWAYLLAVETADRQGWPEGQLKGIGMTWRAMENNLRTLKAGLATLPLLQWPNYEPLPSGAPLPDNWQDGLFLRRDALREWAKVNAPHWLSSASLCEPQRARTISGDELAGFEEAQAMEWNGGPMDWERWTVKSATLTAAQAARLMAGLDPDKFESLAFTKSDKAGPAKAHARRLEQLAAAEEPPKARDTPADWLAWAEAKRERVHGPYRLAIEQAAKAAAPAEQPAAVVRHTLQNRRTHFLAASIRAAQETAVRSSDAAARWNTAAVWTALRAMALNEQDPFTGADGSGLQYTDGDNEPQTFRRDALAAYLKRRRNA